MPRQERGCRAGPNGGGQPDAARRQPLQHCEWGRGALLAPRRNRRAQFSVKETLLRRIRQGLTLLGNQDDKKLHPFGFAMVYCLVYVGRVLRVGLEIQLYPRLHLDRRLAGLLHAALTRDYVDEFLTWMIMLATLRARLALRDEHRDLFSRRPFQVFFHEN